MIEREKEHKPLGKFQLSTRGRTYRRQFDRKCDLRNWDRRDGLDSAYNMLCREPQLIDVLERRTPRVWELLYLPKPHTNRMASIEERRTCLCGKLTQDVSVHTNQIYGISCFRIVKIGKGMTLSVGRYCPSMNWQKGNTTCVQCTYNLARSLTSPKL